MTTELPGHTSTPDTSAAGAPALAASTGRSKTLRNILLIAGSIIILAVLATAAARVASALGREDTSGDFAVSGDFDTIDLRATAADIVVGYGAVSQAELHFDQGDSNLTLGHSVSNGVLRISVENGGWGWWGFGDWGFWNHEGARLGVVLPEGLEGDDVVLLLDTTAGNMQIDGTFGDVRVESTAGDVSLAGEAQNLEVRTTAGDVRLDGYRLNGSLSGDSTAGDTFYGFSSLPEAIDISSTAGNVTVELPDGDYRIETDTTAGEIRQDVSSDAGSDRLYRFETTAGDINIRER